MHELSCITCEKTCGIFKIHARWKSGHRAAEWPKRQIKKERFHVFGTAVKRDRRTGMRTWVYVASKLIVKVMTVEDIFCSFIIMFIFVVPCLHKLWVPKNECVCRCWVDVLIAWSALKFIVLRYSFGFQCHGCISARSVRKVTQLQFVLDAFNTFVSQQGASRTQILHIM